jgi:hypothetical protein
LVPSHHHHLLPPLLLLSLCHLFIFIDILSIEFQSSQRKEIWMMEIHLCDANTTADMFGRTLAPRFSKGSIGSSEKHVF